MNSSFAMFIWWERFYCNLVPRQNRWLLFGACHTKFVMMILHINGRQREFTAETMSVADLVLQLGLQGKRFAMERNGEIVPRGSFENLMLASGDKLEIVGAVGGG